MNWEPWVQWLAACAPIATAWIGWFLGRYTERAKWKRDFTAQVKGMIMAGRGFKIKLTPEQRNTLRAKEAAGQDLGEYLGPIAEAQEPADLSASELVLPQDSSRWPEPPPYIGPPGGTAGFEGFVEGTRAKAAPDKPASRLGPLSDQARERSGGPITLNPRHNSRLT